MDYNLKGSGENIPPGRYPDHSPLYNCPPDNYLRAIHPGQFAHQLRLGLGLGLELELGLWLELR